MTEQQLEEKEKKLVSTDTYLKAGIHIGSQFRTGDMDEYIYKTRQDGLYVLDINKIDERLREVSKFISKFDPNKILVTAGRVYARKPATKFAETIGAVLSRGRFVPGTLTNPELPNFTEPDVVIVSDPHVDKQVVEECKKAKIPVIAIVDSNNGLKNVDLALPANNKGKKSLALLYWILTREYLNNTDKIKSKEDFDLEVEDFEK